MEAMRNDDPDGGGNVDDYANEGDTIAYTFTVCFQAFCCPVLENMNPIDSDGQLFTFSIIVLQYIPQ